MFHGINIESNTNQLTSSEVISVTTIYGIVGIINLLAGPYLLVITKISKVAEIYNQPIFRIDEVEALPFLRFTRHLTDEQVKYNDIYLAMTKSILSSPYFYFSYSYDLTHTFQRIFNFGTHLKGRSLFERVYVFKNTIHSYH